jgi:uncharacterized protein YkwD
VVAGINEFRAVRGRGALVRHGGLDALAQDHAEAMMDRRRLSHDGFARRAREAQSRYGLTRMAENVMWGIGYGEEGLAERIVQEWVESKGHRENLLMANESIGVGIARGRDGSVWAAQLSARR